MVRWREVTFRVPDILAMSDEELRASFPYRDGRWSEAVSRAMKTLGASKLDLNSLWAETPQFWSCPCCGRDKHAILRLSSQGVLLAHLHEHHDHLQDVIAKRLQASVGAHWVEHIPENTYHLEQFGSKLLARFQPKVVCADCNVAEAAAKSFLREVDRDFSFRPSEIAAFITAKPHADHSVDFGAAAQIWSAAEADFRERIVLADSLVEAVLAGRMRQEGRGGRHHLAGDYARHWLSMDARTSGLASDVELLAQRSLAREGFGAQVTSALGRKRRSTEGPSDDDVAAHDGGRFPDLWAKIGNDWRCAGCDRDRKAIVRRSGKSGRRWSGGVRPHREFIFAEEVFGDSLRVEAHVNHLICEDCWSLGPHLRQRDLFFGQTTFTVQLATIRSVITPAPHANHEVDWDRLKALIKAGNGVEAAIAVHQGLVNAAISARRSLAYFREKAAGDEGRAWGAFIHSRRSPRRTPEDVGQELRFLVAEADRLEPLDGVEETQVPT